MALTEERSKLLMVSLGVTSVLTCLSFLCLLIFGVITLTNSWNIVTYNVGAAQIVFAVGSLLVCLGSIAGMLVVAFMIKRSNTMTKDHTTTTTGQPTITTYP